MIYDHIRAFPVAFGHPLTHQRRSALKRERPSTACWALPIAIRACFRSPDSFDVDRANLRRHLGFAAGPHSCVGLNLAKSEARIAIEELLTLLPRFALVGAESGPLRGYQSRQPAALTIDW